MSNLAVRHRAEPIVAPPAYKSLSKAKSLGYGKVAMIFGCIYFSHLAAAGDQGQAAARRA
jgi:hypothetical protein